MGRIKKYLTKEAKLQSRNDASNKYYWKHKEKCDAEQRRRDQLKRDNNKSL